MKSKSTHAVRFFVLSLVVLLVCTFFIWGFQSNWGQIEIKRLYLTGEDGSTVSTLIYIPENATDETPAPVVVILHGRSNHAHSNDTWSMELARRGYVVLSPDLEGGGESDPTVARGSQALTVAEYANTLSFVQHDRINLVGYSMGTQTCLEVYRAAPDMIYSVCEVFGPFMVEKAGGIADVDAHFSIIKSTADQYDYFFVGDPDACIDLVTEMSGLDTRVEPGQDYDRNGNIFRYSEIGGTLHQTGNISGETIQEIVSFEMAINESPIDIPASDTLWIPHQIFSGIACVDMLFILVSLINLLMQLDFFQKASNAVTLRAPQRGAKAWIIDVVFSIVIPAIIFVPVSAYVILWTGEGTAISYFLTSANLNGIMGWLICLAVIGIIRMVIKAKQAKVAGTPMKLCNYGLAGPEETKIDWSKPLKALLMGLICIVFVFTLLWLAEGFLGINYQVWNLSTYLKISPMRILRGIPYVIIIFAVMFIGNMGQRVLPSTGNERRDLWIAVAVNTVMTAAALFILLFIQYGGSMMIGTGETLIPQIDIYGTGENTSCGSLDFAFGYCYMMGGTTGVVTYIYRKYGNIWLGVIPAAIFAGMVTLSGFTVIA